MDGTDTQENIKFRDWTGALNITYRLGPGFMTESKYVLHFPNETISVGIDPMLTCIL